MARRCGPLMALALAACAASMNHREEGARLYEASEYEKAIAHYSKAIESNPEDAEARYRRACARLRLIERDGAASEETMRRVLADLDRALELAPDDYRVYYARAMTHAAAARYKEAISDLLVCLQSKDRTLRPKAHRRIAQIYDEKFEDMQGAALRHYEAYLQMGGNDPHAAARAAELKRAELERAGSPAEPETLLAAAAKLLKDGRIEAGRAVLEGLIAEYPSTESARKAAAILGGLER